MKVKLPCAMYTQGKSTAEICIPLSKNSEVSANLNYQGQDTRKDRLYVSVCWQNPMGFMVFLSVVLVRKNPMVTARGRTVYLFSWLAYLEDKLYVKSKQPPEESPFNLLSLSCTYFRKHFISFACVLQVVSHLIYFR